MPYSDSGASSPLSYRLDSCSVLWRFGGCGRAAGVVSGAAHGARGWRRRRQGVESLRGGVVCRAGGLAAAAGALNLGDLRLHPAWMLGLAMIHHPLLAAFGVLAAAVAAILYGAGSGCLCGEPPTRWPRPWPGSGLRATGRAAGRLGLWNRGQRRCGALGCHLYAVLAARWSGAPLGVPVHPVQAYAALAFLTLSIFLLFWLPYWRQAGDGFGLLLLGAGVAVFVTEFWRDPEGRGTIFGGALDGPQCAAVALVVAGGLVMLERKVPVENRAIPPLPQEQRRGEDGAPNLHESSREDEAAHD